VQETRSLKSTLSQPVHSSSVVQSAAPESQGRRAKPSEVQETRYFRDAVMAFIFENASEGNAPAYLTNQFERRGDIS
jgi:hypothetical protein